MKTMTRSAVKRAYLLHGCPRCEGDLFREAFEDAYSCLQCGRSLRPEQMAALTTRAEAPARELTLAA